MELELDLTRLLPEQLHAFAIDCVEHVLGHDTPELCREALALTRPWLGPGRTAEPDLTGMRRTVEAAWTEARAVWSGSGIPALALRATLAALDPDAERAAAGAATAARRLAAQRGYARSQAASSREHGDQADAAQEQEAGWQRSRLTELAAGREA